MLLLGTLYIEIRDIEKSFSIFLKKKKGLNKNQNPPLMKWAIKTGSGFLKEGADLTTAEIAVRRGNQHCAALSPVFVCGDGGGCTYRPRAIEIRLWLDYVLAFI